MTDDKQECADKIVGSSDVLDADVFYHSPAGMVLVEQHGPVFVTSNAPPSPFYYVRLVDYLKIAASNG